MSYSLTGIKNNKKALLGIYPSRAEAETEEGLLALEPTDENIEFKIGEMKDEAAREIPGVDLEAVGGLPSPFSKALVKNLNNFFVEHSLAKKELKKCNFERAIIDFGEAQQSKGRALELTDTLYRNRLIDSETSNRIVNYVLAFNEAKKRSLLDSIKICER